MATASSKPSQSKASKGERSRTAKLSEMLASEGSPWRPFQETGVLIKAQKSPRDAKAVFAACERRLSSHLKAVCLWPEEQRNETWRAATIPFG